MIVLRSIRFRLTFWYSAILLAGLLLFSGGLWLAVRYELLSSTDKKLAQDVQGIGAVLEEEEGVGGPAQLREELAEYARAAPGGGLLRVRDDTGRELLPGSRLLPGGAAFGLYSTTPQGYRATAALVQIHGRQFVVEAAAPLADVDRMLAQFRNLLFIAIPFVVLIAFGGGYWISRRALAPVDELRSAAQRISAENLSDRLPVPQTGDELQRLAETWNQMLHRLQSSVQRIVNFTADASHELRTPISVILTTAELALRRDRDIGHYREALAGIVVEAQRMTTLTEDLLSLARDDDRGSRLALELLDTSELARRVVDEETPSANEKQIQLTTALEEPIPGLRANRAALRRLLLILLDNAVQHTPAGGAIELEGAKHPNGVMLAVRDNGNGISPEDLPHIFDRFYRADKSRNRANGSGLGLSIAQSIARMHGTQIHAESSLGRGSRFYFVLPE